MIYCKELDQEFIDKEAMFSEIVKNKNSIIAKKCGVVKSGVSISVSKESKAPSNVLETLKSLVLKAQNPLMQKSADYTKELGLPNLKVTATSSTTNFFDSHGDVHIDGCFNQTLILNKQKGFPHIQEHDYDFKNVIADNCKTFVEETSFDKLGFDYTDKTQALKFESCIDPNRNIFMYNQYANGWVKNHSIGMQYINGKIVYCCDSDKEDMATYKANYDKYYPMIANKDQVDAYGCFWAVLELKLIEHSAVVFGSNCTTPTDNVEIEADELLDDQADKSLQNPEKKTQRKRII